MSEIKSEIKLNGDVLTVIDETAKRTAADMVKDLRKQNLLVTGKQSPFQKVETLLFNYKNFQTAIKDKEEQIQEIQQYGLRKKSTSIGSFMSSDGYVDAKSELEKAEDYIDQIEASMQETKNYIRVIDSALEQISDDPYYGIIKMRYFDGCTREAIAEHFDCDVKTVTRNKNRLINLMQIRLFSDQVIRDLFTF